MVLNADGRTTKQVKIELLSQRTPETEFRKKEIISELKISADWFEWEKEQWIVIGFVIGMSYIHAQ